MRVHQLASWIRTESLPIEEDYSTDRVLFLKPITLESVLAYGKSLSCRLADYGHVTVEEAAGEEDMILKSQQTSIMTSSEQKWYNYSEPSARGPKLTYSMT